MDLFTFFQKFDQFADAPDAVAKMRELILESAIRGMLVPHNASDEPTSELLKRIARLQDGQVRKQAALPPVGDDAYLQMPPGWEWTRLGNTGRIFNGDSVSESGKAELAKVEDGLPFIATKDVGYGRAALVYDNGLKVPLRDPRFKVARANAVLICAEGGSAGRKIGVTDRDICFGNKLFANEVWEGIHHRYVFYVYQAPTFFKEFAARMTGIIGGIARSEFLSLPFPLPPLAEQKRIVTKVDELMALCDRLEVQQQERETRHAALARASLARFAEAPTPANLEWIFHPSYQIPPADLRKAILTLAVQGKLVSQDPNDEPAQHAVTKIEKERERLIAAKQFRRSQLPGPIEEGAFDVPETWVWMHLGNAMLNVTDGFHSTPKTVESGVRYVTAKHVKPGLIDFDSCLYVSEDDFKEIASKTRPRKGDVLVVNIGAGSGLASIIEADFEFAFKNVAILNRPEEVDSKFLFNYLVFKRDDIFEEQTKGGAQPFLSLGLIRQIPFPLPPLAEQRRIVAKVDQLMALVDALETQLAASRSTAANLLSSLVAELTGTPNDGKASVPSSDTGRRGRPRKS
jgi:type I restriction enzyme S subunit